MDVSKQKQKRILAAEPGTKGRARAYVLLSAVNGHAADVVSVLLQNRNVVAVDKVEGPPDIVAIIEASSRTKLAAAVVKALSTVEVMIDGVDLMPV